MKFERNSLKIGYWKDYAGIIHINQNGEIQYIKQFPIYHFNEADVYTELQKTNIEIRTLYSIENSSAYFHSSLFVLQPNFVVNNDLTEKSLKTISYDKNTQLLTNHTINNEQSLTCIYNATDYFQSQINPVFNCNTALLQTLESLFVQGVFIHVFQHFFELVYISDNKIQFYNAYNYTHKNDIAYFTANALETLKINATQTNVYIMGRILESSEVVQNIKKFIPNANMLEVEQYNSSKALPQYQNFALIALALCA